MRTLLFANGGAIWSLVHNMALFLWCALSGAVHKHVCCGPQLFPRFEMPLEGKRAAVGGWGHRLGLWRRIGAGLAQRAAVALVTIVDHWALAPSTAMPRATWQTRSTAEPWAFFGQQMCETATRIRTRDDREAAGEIDILVNNAVASPTPKARLRTWKRSISWTGCITHPGELQIRLPDRRAGGGPGMESARVWRDPQRGLNGGGLSRGRS